MPDALPTARRYRAFLSYSRRDAAMAQRVLRSLDEFKVTKSLVGTQGTLGIVPPSLGEIFFDKDETVPGDRLSDLTVAALDASETILVLCSPNAAASAYVNQEIAQFRERHPDRPVIPLIVNCPAGTEATACFPPALMDQAADRLAADLRPEAEGYDRAVGKVAARMLGVRSDAGIRRAQTTLRRRSQAWVAALSSIAILAIGVGGMGWKNHNTENELKDTNDKLSYVSVKLRFVGIKLRHVSDRIGDGSGKLNDVRDDIERIQRDDLPGNVPIDTVPNTGLSEGGVLTERRQSIALAAQADRLIAEAFRLLRSGDPKAEPAVRQIALAKEARIGLDLADCMEAWRGIARFAGQDNPLKAREAYTHILKLDPSNAEALAGIAGLDHGAGRTGVAK